MEIRKFSLLNGARFAEGTTVIIDVFRAFTTAAFIMANGAKEIWPVGTIDEALQLRERNQGWLITGEVHGYKPKEFDYGNSPAEVSEVNFSNKTIIQRTSSGVQGILAATRANDILLGSFVIAEATVQNIKKRDPEIVSLVAMGWQGEKEAIEDELCSEYLEQRLMGRHPDFEEMRQRIKKSTPILKLDPDHSHFRPGDFDFAMSLNRFPFALKVIKSPYIRIVKVEQ